MSCREKIFFRVRIGSAYLAYKLQHGLVHHLMAFFIGMDAVGTHELRAIGVGEEGVADIQKGTAIPLGKMADGDGIPLVESINAIHIPQPF